MNKDGELFNYSSKQKIPLKIYDFAYLKTHTEEEITEFIEKLTSEDVVNAPQVIIYHTSGVIDKLHLYYTDTALVAGQRKIDFTVGN